MEEPEASPREEGGVAVTGAHGGAAVPDDDPPECAVWAMGLPADAVGPVVNRGVTSLRRGRAAAPGPQRPTQRALAQSTGVSDRTVRRLVRVGRDGSDDLRQAVASGDFSVKEADRRLAAARRTGLRAAL